MSYSQSLPDNIAHLYDIDAAVDATLQGKPNRDVAAAMGVSLNQFYQLRFRYPLFKQVLTRAREEGLEALQDKTLTLVDDNLELAPQMVKIKADLLLWYLKVSDPAKYGDRMTIREEHVDLKGALLEAKTRVINVTQSTPKVDPFAD